MTANVYANEADALEMSRPKWPEYCGECTECGWTGPPVATIEEAMRDADAHQCPQSLQDTNSGANSNG